MSAVKIYTSDNILGRAIQSYFCSIVDDVSTLDSQKFIETEPGFSTDIKLVNLISSHPSPRDIINHINTKFFVDNNQIFIIVVDSRDMTICKNITINKGVVILDLNTPLSFYDNIIKTHSSTSKSTKQKNKLTLKERTILSLLLNGNSIANISIRLQCTLKTIYTHRTNIIKKINFKNTMELNKSIARLNATD